MEFVVFKITFIATAKQYLGVSTGVSQIEGGKATGESARRILRSRNILEPKVFLYLDTKFKFISHCFFF